jgi:hypothetical protein
MSFVAKYDREFIVPIDRHSNPIHPEHPRNPRYFTIEQSPELSQEGVSVLTQYIFHGDSAPALRKLQSIKHSYTRIKVLEKELHLCQDNYKKDLTRACLQSSYLTAVQAFTILGFVYLPTLPMLAISFFTLLHVYNTGYRIQKTIIENEYFGSIVPRIAQTGHVPTDPYLFSIIGVAALPIIRVNHKLESIESLLQQNAKAIDSHLMHLPFNLHCTAKELDKLLPDEEQNHGGNPPLAQLRVIAQKKLVALAESENDERIWKYYDLALEDFLKSNAFLMQYSG